MNKYEQYLDDLATRLTPLYHPQRMGGGGHDVTHVLRVAGMEPTVAEVVPDFDHYEYQAAVWLHNADRVPELIESGPFRLLKIGQKAYFGYWEEHDKRFKSAVWDLLAGSPFADSLRERIVDAVLQHSKKDDDPSDSSLLRALRLADKWDRVGLFGIMGGPAMRGSVYLPYDPEHPFGVPATSEDGMTTLYHDFFRILEWYKMSTDFRNLAVRYPQRMSNFIQRIREFGSEIAERHGLRNESEEDIKNALGEYYKKLFA